MQQGNRIAQVLALLKVGGKQPGQQGLGLFRRAQRHGALQQAVGVGGIGHATDTGKIDIHPCRLGGGAHLRLAQAYCLITAQALAVERLERLAGPGHLRQQLHPAPVQAHLNFRLLAPQLLKGPLQMSLADQAPGADKVEEHFDRQHVLHGFNSRAAPGSTACGLSRRAMSWW
ncbi:hypothetical protein D3C79_847310 [compost metagenome]